MRRERSTDAPSALCRREHSNLCSQSGKKRCCACSWLNNWHSLPRAVPGTAMGKQNWHVVMMCVLSITFRGVSGHSATATSFKGCPSYCHI